PARGVDGGLAIATHPGPIQNPLNTASHSGSCRRLFVPDWVQDLRYVRCINVADRQVAHDGGHKGFERVAPLAAELHPPPGDLVTFEKAFDGFVESQAPRPLKPLTGPLSFTFRNRILPFLNQGAICGGQFSGRSETHSYLVLGMLFERPEPHFPTPSADRVPV